MSFTWSNDAASLLAQGTASGSKFYQAGMAFDSANLLYFAVFAFGPGTPEYDWTRGQVQVAMVDKNSGKVWQAVTRKLASKRKGGYEDYGYVGGHSNSVPHRVEQAVQRALEIHLNPAVTPAPGGNGGGGFSLDEVTQRAAKADRDKGEALATLLANWSAEAIPTAVRLRHALVSHRDELLIEAEEINGQIEMLDIRLGVLDLSSR